MKERVVINLRKYRLLAEVGLKQEIKRLSYATDAVQDILHRAFGDLLPEIKQDENGVYYYENYDRNGRETTRRSRQLKSGERWPRHEVKRLLRGFKTLQALAKEVQHPRIRAMLLDLQFPDPVRDAHCYRLYRDTLGHARLHILHGFIRRHDLDGYPAANLISQLRSLYGLEADGSDDPRLAKPSTVKNPLSERNQSVSTLLSLACVLSLSSVFIAYYITTIPELIACHTTSCELFAPVQSMEGKRIKPDPQKSGSATDSDYIEAVFPASV